MSRLTNHQDSEIVCEYYGINRQTYKVECVAETKGGILSLMRGGNYITHPLIGQEGEHECIVAFELTEIRAVRGSMIADQGHTDRIRAELREKAAQMRASGWRFEKPQEHPYFSTFYSALGSRWLYTPVATGRCDNLSLMEADTIRALQSL